MNRNKCSRCGLVNSTADQMCRRCRTSLVGQPAPESDNDGVEAKRGIVRRLTWILGTTLILLFAWYLSLLASSDRLGFDRRKTVADAVMVLEQKGFRKEAFVLRNLVT
jgi:hypothetical protein